MRTWNMGRGRQRSRFESASRSAHCNRWTAPCRVLAFLSTIWAWTFRNHWKAMWRLPSRATMLFGSAFCIRSLTAPPTMSWLPRRARERDRPGTSRDSSIRGAKVFAVCAALQVCAGYVRISVLSSDTSPTHPIALKLRPSRARGACGRVGGRYRRRGRGRFSGSSRWRHRGGASAYETDQYRDRGGEGDIFQKFHSGITSIGYFVRQQGAPNQGFQF